MSPWRSRIAALTVAGLLAAPPAVARDTRADRAGSGCVVEATAVASAVRAAEDAFAAMDSAAFQVAYADALDGLRCLTVPVTPRLAADLHRVVVLQAFRDQDEALVLAAMASLLRLQPAFQFPDRVVSPGHPLARLLVQAQSAAPGAPVTVRTPRGTSLRIDGQRASERTRDLPEIAQVLTDQGEVLWSDLLLPGIPVPLDDIPNLPASPRQRVSTAAAFASAGTLVAGCVFMGLALNSRAAAQDLGDAMRSDPTPTAAEREQFNHLATRSNALGVGGQAALGVGLGLGVVAIMGRW